MTESESFRAERQKARKFFLSFFLNICRGSFVENMFVSLVVPKRGNEDKEKRNLERKKNRSERQKVSFLLSG